MVLSRRKLRVGAIALLVLGTLLLVACTDESDHLGPTTTTTIFPSQRSFEEKLSGDGYGTPLMFVDGQGAAKSLIVWIPVDTGNETRATDDAIFDHAVALAEKYQAANSTGGRMTVGLFAYKSGGFVKDNIFESRDFDLSSPPSMEPSTVTTKLYPAVDNTLGQLRLDANPREGVRVAFGGLREIPADTIDPRKRLIEGEIIIENRSDTPFACGPDDFRLHVGPFQTQIQGLTASTDFPVRDALLAPSPVEGHAFMTEGAVQPGDTLHGYLLTWIADRGTASSGLQYDPSDPDAADQGFGVEIQP